MGKKKAIERIFLFYAVICYIITNKPWYMDR